MEAQDNYKRSQINIWGLLHNNLDPPVTKIYYACPTEPPYISATVRSCDKNIFMLMDEPVIKYAMYSSRHLA